MTLRRLVRFLAARIECAHHRLGLNRPVRIRGGFAIRHRVLSLFLLLIALALIASAAGCRSAATAGAETTLVSADAGIIEGQVTTSTLNGTRPTTELLRRAQLALAGAMGVEVADMHIAAVSADAPGANAVIAWEGGRAEVDDSTGRVYSAIAEQRQPNALLPLLTEERLEMEALGIVRDLGWTDGTLAGLGFKQHAPGTLAEDTGLYTITWGQFDEKGKTEDGFIVMELEGRTGRLVGFSVWLGSDAPEIAGTISEADALVIAQTQIYLHTDKPKIPLAGDGSLILLNRSSSQELRQIEDSKIVKEPTLCWEVTITGTVNLQVVGGTVYIDARTGEVKKYQAYKTSEPATTTSSLVP